MSYFKILRENKLHEIVNNFSKYVRMVSENFGNLAKLKNLSIRFDVLNFSPLTKSVKKNTDPI